MKISDLRPELLEEAAEMLRAIAHPVRMQILSLLEYNEAMSVKDIHSILKIEQATASHHLGILKDKSILISRREGRSTYYSLRHQNLATIVNCISHCVM